jgi:hypothetical protein
MDELLLQHTLVNDEEEMDLLDEEEELKMVAATLVAGVELARLNRIESRNPSRLCVAPSYFQIHPMASII